jgi:hypothetical protein
MMMDRNVITLYVFVLAISLVDWDEVSKPMMI